jgi:hypothetical protein
LKKKLTQLSSTVEDEKESLLMLQKQCEGDIKSLRNLTLDFMNSVNGNWLQMRDQGKRR